MSLQPIILCGGEGKRLWPVSNKILPKQFIKFFGQKSLFELTIERLQSIRNCKLPIIVLSKNHQFLVEDILKNYEQEATLIFEPHSKNTTAAIYLAASYAHKKDTLLIMPSDHIIPNVREFSDIIINADSKLDNKSWMLFGIIPNTPSTEFGYFQTEKQSKKDSVQIIKSFVEKPSIGKALEMVNSGKYLWNSGIFLVKVKKALSSIKIHAPEVVKICNKLFHKQHPKNKDNKIFFDIDLFASIPNISIDYSVLEKENNLLCIRFLSQWSDLGSWDKVIEMQPTNKFKQNIVEIDGSNELITNQNRIIGTVGVSDLIIVDTKDATLITKKNRSNDINKLINKLDENKNLSVNNCSHETKPWGTYDVLLNSELSKVKILNILPKNRLSLQYHRKRSEHWIVISGKAYVHIDGNEYIMSPGESIDIKKEAKHFIANKDNKPLVIIEVQMGEYFGEDDIVRLEDPYNR